MNSRYFLYARKSTDTEDKQVLSIEAQLYELRLFAERERLTIAREFIEARTAKAPGRPIFGDVMKRIERGEAAGILAWHPDRLARNSVDGGQIVYLLDTGRLRSLKFPTFWFENSPQGLFMLNISFAQSKHFSDNLSVNVKRGMRQKLRKGDWPHRAPLGYLNDKNSGKVVTDPDKAALVRRMFEEFASGKHTIKSLRVAARSWGLVGREGRPLALSKVHEILRETFHYGLMHWAGETYEGRHEAIISKELFDRVQKILRRSAKPMQTRHSFPFLGLAKCGTCGCSITAQLQKGHTYYACTKKREKCGERYLRGEELSKQIDSAIQSVALPTATYEKIMNHWAKEREDSSHQMADLQKNAADELAGIRGKLDRLLDAHLNGVVDNSEYLGKKESLLNRKLEIEGKMAQWERSAISWLEPAKEFLEAAHQAGLSPARHDPEIQNDFFRKIGLNPTIQDRKLNFSYSLPWSLLASRDKNSEWRAMTDSNRRPSGSKPDALSS